MNKTIFSTKNLVILGLLTAIVIIFSITPFGTIPVGPLSITLNMIPVCIAAVSLGPSGGMFVGGVFGLLSFLQSLGIGIPSGLGILTFSISPFLTFVQRFVSRLFVGWLLGFIFKVLKKRIKASAALAVTGGAAAILNFVFFMGLLWLCFGSSPEFMDYLNNTIGKATMGIYVAGTFLTNTILEIVVTAVVIMAVGIGLKRARLLNSEN